ncbi:hypothetical protein [Actinoplanes palleronii]|uniref:Uncharacterized protein n=1 Tax=Actinoplanes palleronii TaxID=113570 RepID=A0ABQ4BHA7_9ACTN|nr:hypothetical protein [Actinoplanes palleronii]GIE70066.1 hypothetical protein Apa02nite_061740 [Actinoplanes palleronii]
MSGWLHLVPEMSSGAVDPVPVESWPPQGPQHQRLTALYWHAGLLTDQRPAYHGTAELYALTAESVPWHRDDLVWALQVLARQRIGVYGAGCELPGVIASQLPVEQLGGFEPVLWAVHDAILDDREVFGAKRRELVGRLRTAIRRLSGDLVTPLLFGREGFGPAARRLLGDRGTDPATSEVLEHAVTLTRPVPSKAWLRRAAALRAASPMAASAVRDVLAAFLDHDSWPREEPDPRPREEPDPWPREEPDPWPREEPDIWLREEHDVLVRGLCWIHALDGSPEATVLLGRVAEVAGAPRRPGANEPKAGRAAAAAVETLVDRPGAVPADVLTRLALSTQSKPVQNRVQQALKRLPATHS